MADIIPGVITHLNDLVMRITAPNPGMMTGPGTNTYIIGRNELALIDPGPESVPHLGVLLDVVGDRLKWILCTHTHRDHSPGALALRGATGAEVLGFPMSPDDGRQDPMFAPDLVVGDGDVIDCGIFRLRVVHTPGHASNHLCYLLEEHRMLFTGDHIMEGSTVVIWPPDGDMTAYLQSLDRLLSLELASLAPGHGRLIEAPYEEVCRLIAHRLKREEKVLDAFESKNPATLDELLPIVYSDTALRLHPVARRSLHAHLVKLQREGRVVESGELWEARR